MKVQRLGMFELHCEELISSLSRRADGLAQKMLTYMSKTHQIENERLCQAYDLIATKALSTPANTEELVELKKYIKQVKEELVAT